MSDFSKASDIFGINKFEEIEEYFIVTCDFSQISHSMYGV